MSLHTSDIEKDYKMGGDDLTAKVTHDVGEIADAASETKVRRKIDWVLMPLLGFCYMLQFLDKLSLNYSSLLGILEDISLGGNRYSWASAVFYIGYLVWSWPTSYLVVRFPIGKYLSISVILWAAVLLCHAACNSYASLMVVRFLLGATEAAVAPGFALIVSLWYRRQEQPLRQGAWFMGNSIASIIGGVISYAIGHINGSLGNWQYLFLIFGAITALWGVVMIIFLPDSQATTWWLRKDEREVAARRVTGSRIGTFVSAPGKGNFDTKQVIEAFSDPATYLLFLYIFTVNLANGGLTAFGSLVIKGFGYQGLDALLLQMPAGATQLGFVIVACYLSTRFSNIRIFLMFFLTLVSVAGLTLMYALDPANRSGRLAGYCLAMGYAANMPLGLSLTSSNVGGITKRAVVNGCIFVAYCAGNIAGPQFFSVTEAPRYERGITASLAGLCLGAGFIISLRFWYSWENGRRQKQFGNMDENSEIVYQDTTDRQTRATFRYVL